MKILIGENTELYSLNDEYIKILVRVFGSNNTYWKNKLHDKNENYKLRQSKQLQDYFIEHDMVIYKEMVKYICDDFETELVHKVKIVDIPDDVQWHIESCDCAEAEEIVENHRCWSSNEIYEVDG